MLHLSLQNISYTWPSRPNPTLTNLSVSLQSGWYALVGDNGAGKTTFARILCKQIKPDAGTIISGANDLLSIYCAQESVVEPDDLSDFALDWGETACRIRRELEIDDEWMWDFQHLSAGQKKRVQVGYALWREPDVLVLDEPTNHVDRSCRQALIGACKSFSGIGLVISHDRELLEELPQTTLVLDGSGIHAYSGTYSQASSQMERQRTEAVHARENARRELSRLKAEQTRRAQAAAASAARRSARGLDVHDHDGRGRIGLAIVTGKDGVTSRAASTMLHRVQRAQEELSRTHVAKRYNGDIWMGCKPHTRPTIARMENAVVPFDPALDMFEPENGAIPDERGVYVRGFALGNTDHVGIEGDNGAGKSTFVRALLQNLDEDVVVCVMPQELGEVGEQALLGRFEGLGNTERGRVLSAFTQMAGDADRLLETLQAAGRINSGEGKPSPGELRKLLVAMACVEGAQLLVLDEPTNYMDLHSAEALERALAAWPGALVVVSHDEELLNAIGGHRLYVGGGVVEQTN